jgi:plasmid stabilization system protein ParE
MKVRWSQTALAEIEDIFSYIHEHNRSAATAVVERIEGLTALLEDFRASDTLPMKRTSVSYPSCAIRS